VNDEATGYKKEATTAADLEEVLRDDQESEDLEGYGVWPQPGLLARGGPSLPATLETYDARSKQSPGGL